MEKQISVEMFKRYTQKKDLSVFSFELGNIVHKYFRGLSQTKKLSILRDGIVQDNTLFSRAIVKIIKDPEKQLTEEEIIELSSFIRFPLSAYDNVNRFNLSSSYKEFIAIFDGDDIQNQLDQLAILKQCDCYVDLNYKNTLYLSPRVEKPKTKMISQIDPGSRDYLTINNKKIVF